MEPSEKGDKKYFFSMVLEIVLKIAMLAVLVLWCFDILRPFAEIILWGVIIAVSIYPFYIKLAGVLGNRLKMAAVVLTMLLIVIILLPTALLTGSLMDGTHKLAARIDSGQTIPEPPEKVGQWPVIGGPVESAWRLASENLDVFMKRYQAQLKSFSAWLIGTAVGSGLEVLKFLASIIVAGILLPNSERQGHRALKLFTRLAGERGEEFTSVTVVTIRNVARGILGVAFFQALTAGIGCAVAGVPAAGLWAFLCLFLAIIQIGIFPVTIPIIIYMFSQLDTVPAVILAVWLGAITVCDNFLKPVLLGRGAPVPMLVIFLGAIGGFITMGFMGLFIGAIVLSVGYRLYESWIAGAGEQNMANIQKDQATP